MVGMRRHLIKGAEEQGNWAFDCRDDVRRVAQTNGGHCIPQALDMLPDKSGSFWREKSVGDRRA